MLTWVMARQPHHPILFLTFNLFVNIYNYEKSYKPVQISHFFFLNETTFINKRNTYLRKKKTK